ncbi:MAG: hypothetical protein Q6352_010090 [Candidatus Freyrarchaeum guaymaensis]
MAVVKIAGRGRLTILSFLKQPPEIDLLAFALMKQYKITSVFDAYYAATVLN